MRSLAGSAGGFGDPALPAGLARLLVASQGGFGLSDPWQTSATAPINASALGSHRLQLSLR